MIILGLTGSLGMGKSEAAKILHNYGLPVFDSDAEVHKLYNSASGAELIRPYVPEATSHGKVDRTILSAAVLAEPELLARIEKPVHKAIARAREGFLYAAKSAGAEAVVLDIPLLFETGADAYVDKTIVISARPELQRARVLARPGMTQARFEQLLSKQMPDSEKRARADVVIENNSSLEDLKIALHDMLKKWGL